MMESGVPIDTIQRRLGHESSKVTKEIYLHITEKLKKVDNEKIAQVVIFEGAKKGQKGAGFRNQKCTIRITQHQKRL